MVTIIRTLVWPRLNIFGPPLKRAKSGITDKFKGDITVTRQIELSRDLKTLTISMLLPGKSKPKNILVFNRE